MTIPQPKSLTALVHLKFDYEGVPTKRADKTEVQILADLLDRISEMDPALAEMLIKFADYVEKTGERKRA